MAYPSIHPSIQAPPFNVNRSCLYVDIKYHDLLVLVCSFLFFLSVCLYTACHVIISGLIVMNVYCRLNKAISLYKGLLLWYIQITKNYHSCFHLV